MSDALTSSALSGMIIPFRREARHPRLKMHFTPTSSSWLNLVERFFADLTGNVIRAGSFTSVKELVEDINAYLGERNASPKPYTWTAKGEAILEKIHRIPRRRRHLGVGVQVGPNDTFSGNVSPLWELQLQFG
jgi:hypothetical protein